MVSVVALFGGLVFGGPDDEAQKVRRWIANSTIVFKGTVTKLNDSTFKTSNVLSKATTDRSVVVRVDQLVKPTPEVTRLFANTIGKEITVYDSSTESLPKLKIGDKATFFANGWLFGETIAVRALGRLASTTGAAPSAAIAPSPPGAATTTSREDLLLESHLNKANAVVVGKELTIRPLAEQRQHAVSALASSREPVSEHDPHWREAVVEVQSVEKGEVPQKRIVVVFAASRDVAWFKAPKFKKDQEGVIVLHKQQIPSPQLNQAMLAASPEDVRDDVGGIYTAIDPRDFLAAKPSEINRVKQMLKK